MRNQRSFSLEFKRQVVEELMSGGSRPAQLCRRYDFTASLLYHWKRQYSRGTFNNKPSEEGAVPDRVGKLERLVGKLTLENEVLTRGWQHSLSRSQRNGRSSGYGDVSTSPSGWGCQVIALSRSSFYHRPKDRSQGEMEKEGDLRGRTEGVCE